MITGRPVTPPSNKHPVLPRGERVSGRPRIPTTTKSHRAFPPRSSAAGFCEVDPIPIGHHDIEDAGAELKPGDVQQPSSKLKVRQTRGSTGSTTSAHQRD